MDSFNLFIDCFVKKSTPADDKLVGKAYKIIDWFALNIGRAKEK